MKKIKITNYINIKYFGLILVALNLIFLTSCAETTAKFETRNLKTTKLTLWFKPKGGLKGTADNYPISVFFRLNSSDLHKNYKYAQPINIGSFRSVGNSTIFSTEKMLIKKDATNEKAILTKDGGIGFEIELPISFKYVFNGEAIGRKSEFADHSGGLIFTVRYGKNSNVQQSFEVKMDPEVNGGVIVFKDKENNTRLRGVLNYDPKNPREGIYYNPDSQEKPKPLLGIGLYFQGVE